MGWIVIRRWDEFQHRDMARSTVPPWIKTYTKLMGDDDFLRLSFHLRGVLLSLWLEYATARRQLSDSTVGLSRRLGHRVTTRDLVSLSRAGFIEVSASKPAGAHAGKVAGLEVEVEKKVLRSSAKNRTPFSAPAPPAPRVNMPPLDEAAYVRGLVANRIVTEAFELDYYNLADDVRDELKAKLNG